MGKNSSIEWTDHTFNPWWGCTKVSPGCEHCYAETWAHRVGQDVWGAKQDRRFFTDKHWHEPIRWNADAAESKKRRRVFCASMADVFENRDELNEWRSKLWKLITDTPWLDWLLLTKRPQNIEGRVPWTTKWPTNIWLGTTVEDQTRANERLPILLQFPAARRFLSCEPLLGAVDLSKWTENRPNKLPPIDWVIAGGEMLPGWARGLRDQCRQNGIPFHFKQWGHWAPVASPKAESSLVRKFADDVIGENIFMEAKGKKVAGRRLDGAVWDGIPSGIHHERIAAGSVGK
jgi:protein gp37